MPKLIALVCRHGETAANAKNVFRARLDPPLNEKGIREAEKLAKYIEKNYTIYEIVSSPMLRALQTADIIADKVSVKVKQDRGLISWALGFLQGKDKDEYNDILDYYIDNPTEVPPDGESLRDLEDRTDDFFKEELKADPQDRPTGTSISGYSNKGAFHCAQCIHKPSKGSSYCNHPKVVSDPALASKKVNGLIQIDREHGCCEYVKPAEENLGVKLYATHTSNLISLENLFHGNPTGRPESNEDSVSPGGLAEIWEKDDGDYELRPVIGEQQAAFGE
jgi:hypothetical protein